MKTNILLLSAGRRVELLKAFQRDLKVLGLSDARVFATDMHPALSPACLVADQAFTVPRVTASGYIDIIFNLCIEQQVRIVVPTIDTELLLLSAHKLRFAEQGITILISDQQLIEQCRDKRETGKLFDSLNIDNPKILDKNNLVFPCFCKPYDGSCSIGAVALNSPEDLTLEQLNAPKNMFMELVPKSFYEYTIDAYYSNHGVLKCLVPRKRIEVRAGEVSKGVTRKNFVYDYLKERVIKLDGARGCITFQLFVEEQTQSIKGLEVNPRFGGGFPLADAAGAHFTKWVIQEYILNQELSFTESWETDLLMLRYDAKVLSRNYVE
ncbi:ATP-grasp domain-containing protein [Paraferrimonas sp. SM1919]|uniref:ATP-grasp domain-containing protein n=1 Tax=Paraferrimonas sp. SM1919 TaxID=2662263 RepID=UPI0013D30886|nr:ATP-grasp domain-containing protein [Paraferrimonas sp. SM1919]